MLSSPIELIYLCDCVCVCLYDVRVVVAIADGVNEEEYREPEFDAEYREPEFEGQYLDQDFPEGFVNNLLACSISSFDCIFRPSFINTTEWSILQNCICFYC